MQIQSDDCAWTLSYKQLNTFGFEMMSLCKIGHEIGIQNCMMKIGIRYTNSIMKKQFKMHHVNKHPIFHGFVGRLPW